LAIDFKDPRVQKFVLSGVFVFGFLYAYYSLLYKAQTEEIGKLQTRLSRIERHVAHARERVERHDIVELKAELVSLENQLRMLERLLPRMEEVPDLLEMIERKGIRTGIHSVLFEPAGSKPGPLYEELVYKITVRGGYHEIGNFLAKVGSSSRVIKTSRMSLLSQREEDRRDRGVVLAEFELSTFIMPDGGPGRAGREGGDSG